MFYSLGTVALNVLVAMTVPGPMDFSELSEALGSEAFLLSSFEIIASVENTWSSISEASSVKSCVFFVRLGLPWRLS